MSLYPVPEVVYARRWLTVPNELRKSGTVPEWSLANYQGRPLDCFLEGPVFDGVGNLWLTDIPYGRLFSVSPDGEWHTAIEYDGWPNGLAVHKDGRIFIADYKKGILVFDPIASQLDTLVDNYHSEHFRGCNDLIIDSGGGYLYFTDQGQSGMHRPNGRVYRYELANHQLQLLVDTCPSPNGLMLKEDESMLYVAMTRGNCIWRVPLMADGTVSKVGVFIQLSGGLAGPDGMERGPEDSIHVAHAGNGCVWSFDRLGVPVRRIMSQAGLHTTNVTFASSGDMVITESSSGSVLIWSPMR